MNIKADEHPQYNPDVLLDTIKDRLGLKNDAALAKRLGIAAPIISKIRHRRQEVSSDVLISMHEETKLSIRDLRFLSGDFRHHTGRSATPIPPERAEADCLWSVSKKCKKTKEKTAAEPRS
ncbi:helix-turn-helix domain-containing protein [Rugamonas aquatica]|uniref:HTH cro/C1-type domain-containing protein n=1 Tax=Rugamonas aquatica TaxID=2743357 RepID=A0A6A7N721_9BURK|nr:helix-turn-helix domain-containing protein [Rugamonas aquatica]MQA40741.1 hypothetical protein [Rugamonas aquatica]